MLNRAHVGRGARAARRAVFRVQQHSQRYRVGAYAVVRLQFGFRPVGRLHVSNRGGDAPDIRAGLNVSQFRRGRVRLLGAGVGVGLRDGGGAPATFDIRLLGGERVNLGAVVVGQFRLAGQNCRALAVLS